jgi:hypothetical protein
MKRISKKKDKDSAVIMEIARAIHWSEKLNEHKPIRGLSVRNEEEHKPQS